MNYLPIRENVNHLKVKNTFRLDSIEEATPAKWGGYGKNQPTKKYEYFYNKTDMMLSINGNATNGADTSMLVLDNINMYEVDMIPFFKYFDEDNIYKGIQIPYIGEAPDIDYLNSDFVFIDNITVGVDAIDANGNNSLATDCQTAVIITTPTITPTFVVITNQSPDSAMPDPKSFVINQNNNSDIQLNAYIVASNISDEPTEVEWTTIFSSGTSITIIAGNTLTPTVSGLASGNYRLRVRAVSATSSVLLSPITDTAIIIINISTTVTTVTTVPTVTTQPITLTRFGGPDSKVQELLQNTVTSIVYDSVNGYTFNLILNTISGYRFVNTAASIVSGSWFDNTVYTINSSTFTSGDTQLTLNIKITGVAPSITNLSYVVTVNTGTYAPKITNNPNGYTISGPGGTGNLNYTSKDITLENNTGVDIWLWVGVNQFTTGSNGAAVDTLYYNGFTIYFPFSVIELDDVPTTNGQYFSTIPYQVPTGSSIAGSLFRGYTSDTAHTVQLWYSYSITGTKYMLGT
jgi:hypothetical protein